MFRLIVAALEHPATHAVCIAHIVREYGHQAWRKIRPWLVNTNQRKETA